MGSYAMRNYLMNKFLLKSKDKQLMEYDGKPVKERIRRLLDSESEFKAAIDKILPEKNVAILFGNIVLELIKEDDRNARNIPASFPSGLMYMKPKRGSMVKQHKRLLEIFNGLEDAKEIDNGLSSAPCLEGGSCVSVTHNHTMNGLKVSTVVENSDIGGASNPAGADLGSSPIEAGGSVILDIRTGLSSAPFLERASSIGTTHNHTLIGFKAELEMSGSSNPDNGGASNTTGTDSSNGGSSNPDNSGASNTTETDPSNGGSSQLEAGGSLSLEVGNDPDDQNPDDVPLIAPRRNGSGGNNGNPDMIYWTGIHRVFLKISFVVGGAKLYLYDTESGQSSTDYVSVVMGGVAFLSSILGLIAAHKYPNFSKGLAVVGGPSAMFAVIASMTEVIYPEYAILVGGAGSLVSLLLLLDTALGFKESGPPFLACMKRALGFQCISPEGQVRPPV